MNGFVALIVASLPLWLLAFIALDPSSARPGIKWSGTVVCTCWAFLAMQGAIHWVIGIVVPLTFGTAAFVIGRFVERHRRPLTKDGCHTCTKCGKPLSYRSFVPYVEFFHGTCHACIRNERSRRIVN